MAAQHLFMLAPDTVFTALVDVAEPTYPLSSVEFDNVGTGAYTDIKVGMTVLFGSSAGLDDLGRKRIRAAADSDTIFVGRGSQGKHDGELNIENNDHITIIDDRRVWSKIPDISDGGEVVKDEEAYTDQTSEIPPKANITGGWRASTINSGTSVSTFQFIGTASFARASGATISTYLWDVGDGTITVGTSGSNTITATFPAGKRWVSLTVTDSNGKTQTSEVLVYAHNPAASECVAFQCVEHTITADGQRCGFNILEDIPATTYPDGTAVIFWEGEPASASDYSNVKFWGWHQTDNNTVTAERTGTLKNITLNCLDLAGRLDTLPSFPQSLSRKSSPDNWLEMAGLDMPLYIDYLLRWHSTAFELGYYVSNIPSGYDMVVISSDGASIWNQASQMAGALEPDYRLTCDRNGHMTVNVDPVLQDIGDRTATNQATLTDANWTAAQWDRQRPPRFHWNWGEAIQAHSTGEPEALFCRAPGIAPGQGLTSVTSNYNLAPSQTVLNAVEGHRYGYMNAFHGQIFISLPTDSGIEAADMTWVTLTVASTYSRRALGFSSARCIPVEINITYNYSRTGLSKSVELLLEEETDGTPAVTYEPPEIEWDWTPPPVIIPPPPTTVGDGFGTVYSAIGNTLGRTRDFSASSPAWANISPSGSYTFRDFILDPYNPPFRSLHLSSAGVNISENMNLSSPTWSLALSKAAIETEIGYSIIELFKIVGSINQEDYFGFLAYTQSAALNDHWYIYTENGGSSWNYSKITTSATGYSSIDIVPHVIGGSLTVYAALHVNNDLYINKSTDKGASWANISTTGLASSDRVTLLHCPYNGNEDGLLLYTSHFASGGRIYRSTNGGVALTEISGVLNGTQIKRAGIETFTNDNQLVYWWRQIGGGGGLYTSSNGGTSWSAAAASGLTGSATAAGGFPTNGQQYYVITTDGIFVSIDGGASFVNKTGDWAFGFTSSSASVVYYNVIVPDWTE